MAANLMDLVRELKALQARKKAGETLNAAEEERRKELKAYLRSTLEAQGGAGGSTEDSAVRESPARASGTTQSVPPVQLNSQVASRGVSVTQSNPPVQLNAPRGVSVTQSNPPVAVPQRPAPVSAVAPAVPAPVTATQPAAVPAAAPAPQPYVPKKNAFAIDVGVADALIGDAMKSEAVAKVDPWSERKAHASMAEISESEERAEAALRANKKRERVKDAEGAVAQLKEIEAAYTPPVDAFTFEQYYADYETEGFVYADPGAAAGLKPIDPREIELQRAGVEAGSAASSGSLKVPRGLGFIDDFPALYSRRILPPPDEELVADSNDPNLIVPGKRKVTVHLMNGEKKQGSIRQMRRGDLGFKLEPVGSGLAEDMSISQCRAVFIHLATNAQPKAVQGRPLTVTFRDGRSAQGVSDDYQPGAPVFSIIPPVGRGQFERVIINGAYVQSVA